MPEARQVRIGLAGLGRMGRIHARSLAAGGPSARLAAVFDAAEPAAREVGEQYGVPAYTSYEDLLADPAVQAVAVATPTASHAELVTRAAAAGKHVFCEKPIALDRASTLAAIEAAAAAGVLLQVGFHRRFDPDWVAAVGRIHAGELGRVYLLRSSLRDMTPPSPEFLAGSGGFFRDVAIHDLDAARWIAGEVVEVSAHGAALSDPGFEAVGDLDVAVVVLRFASGALGVLDGSRAAGYGYEGSTEVMGGAATARIDHPQRHHYEWRTPGWAAYPIVGDFEQRYPQAYPAELEAFARSVRDGLPLRATGLDALAAFDLASAADMAWRTGQRVPLASRPVPGGVRYDPAD